MTTLYLREADIRRGAQLRQQTAAIADQSRSALKHFLHNLTTNRKAFAAEIEETFDSVMAVSVLENLALLAAAPDADHDQFDLLARTGMALKAMFTLEWNEIPSKQRLALASQIFGFSSIAQDATEPVTPLAQFCSLVDCNIRLELDRVAGKAVYADRHLLICTERCSYNSKPELYVCLPHRQWWIWSFYPMPGMNQMPPTRSIRAAQSAVCNWRGPRLSGRLCGSGSDRICRLLGLRVDGFNAYLDPQRKGFA